MKKTIMYKSVSLFLAFLIVIAAGIPIAVAVSQPTIMVGSVEGNPGDTISVSITVENNPGIIALRIFVEYDAEVLQLTGVQDGIVFSTGKSTFNNHLKAIPYTMLWEDGASKVNYSSDGTLVMLTFTVLKSAKGGNSPVTVSYDSSSTFNVDLTEVPFTMQNGSVTVTEEEQLYTATFTVDGTEISAKQYHAGDTIVKPADPVKDGYTFKGWMPAVPATMPTQDMTFTAVFEKVPDPVIKIHNFTANKTVDYRTTITFSVDEIQNPVDDASVHWFINGQDKGESDTYTEKEAKATYTVQAKYMKGNTVLAESETETVSVKTGFFARLKAFFRALFGRLPKEVQEYLGVEIIERVLP